MRGKKELARRTGFSTFGRSRSCSSACIRIGGPGDVAGLFVLSVSSRTTTALRTCDPGLQGFCFGGERVIGEFLDITIASIVAVRCLPHARKIGCGWSAGAALTLINASSPKRTRIERNDRHRLSPGAKYCDGSRSSPSYDRQRLSEFSEPPRIPFP